MLGAALLSASRNPRLRRALVAAPVTWRVVDRFVAGEQLSAGMAAAGHLVSLGLAVALQDKRAIDRAYGQCLEILMAGPGYPMVGSHDPAMINRALRLARDHGRDPRSFEFQMLYGMRPREQQRLAGTGYRTRVYLPYGSDWYGYFMRRLAERPANVVFCLRALTTRA